MKRTVLAIFGILIIILGGCTPASKPALESGFQVIAAESFLADIAQNVAGDRLVVETLIPRGTDPHTFQPAPADIAKIEDADLVIISGAGLEEGIQQYLENTTAGTVILEASEGLAFRTPGEFEMVEEHGEHDHEHEGEGDHDHEGEGDGDHEGEGEGDHDHEGEGEHHHHHHENDPHFWFDPNLVMTYVENIRLALSELDPDGAETYKANADAYITNLSELDTYIKSQVEKIPAEKRKLVMDHVSFGYCADRYGFQIVGAVIPSVSTGASPTPQEMAALIDRIQDTGAAAIFIPTTANPELAAQVAEDAGVALVTGLYTHYLSEAGGPAPTYIDMMRLNVDVLVEALK